MPPELYNQRRIQKKIDLAEAVDHSHSVDLRIVTAEFVRDFNKLKDAAIEKLTNLRAAPKKLKTRCRMEHLG